MASQHSVSLLGPQFVGSDRTAVPGHAGNRERFQFMNREIQIIAFLLQQAGRLWATIVTCPGHPSCHYPSIALLFLAGRRYLRGPHDCG